MPLLPISKATSSRWRAPAFSLLAGPMAQLPAMLAETPPYPSSQCRRRQSRMLRAHAARRCAVRWTPSGRALADRLLTWRRPRWESCLLSRVLRREGQWRGLRWRKPYDSATAELVGAVCAAGHDLVDADHARVADAWRVFASHSATGRSGNARRANLGTLGIARLGGCDDSHGGHSSGGSSSSRMVTGNAPQKELGSRSSRRARVEVVTTALRPSGHRASSASSRRLSAHSSDFFADATDRSRWPRYEPRPVANTCGVKRLPARV